MRMARGRAGKVTGWNMTVDQSGRAGWSGGSAAIKSGARYGRYVPCTGGDGKVVEPQLCPACGGGRVTEKIEHTVETDSRGDQVAREHRYLSPCGRCGGTGEVWG